MAPFPPPQGILWDMDILTVWRIPSQLIDWLVRLIRLMNSLDWLIDWWNYWLIDWLIACIACSTWTYLLKIIFLCHFRRPTCYTIVNFWMPTTALPGPSKDTNSFNCYIQRTASSPSLFYIHSWRKSPRTCESENSASPLKPRRKHWPIPACRPTRWMNTSRSFLWVKTPKQAPTRWSFRQILVA